MSVASFIQARMDSTRCPGKVLKEIHNRPTLWWVIERVKRAEVVDQIVVLTSTSEIDQQIVEFCNEQDVDVFTGPEDDVLKRFYLATVYYEPEIISRVCADSPLSDYHEIDRALTLLSERNCDYVTNTMKTSPDGEERKVPIGMAVEAFTSEALKRTHSRARKPDEREHLTRYMRMSTQFDVERLSYEEDLSNWQLAVDYPEDLEYIRRLIGELQAQDDDVLNLTLKEITQFIKKNESLSLPLRNNNYE